MKTILNKVEDSFKLANAGKEDVNTIIWYWGFIAYCVALFVVHKTILTVDYRAFDVAASMLMVVYFSWHIYVLRKCAPKKPKLSKEEKKLLKMEKRKDFGKRLMRKVFLRESFTKWDPIFVVTVIDLFCVVNFLSYI